MSAEDVAAELIDVMTGKVPDAGKVKPISNEEYLEIEKRHDLMRRTFDGTKQLHIVMRALEAVLEAAHIHQEFDISDVLSLLLDELKKVTEEQESKYAGWLHHRVRDEIEVITALVPQDDAAVGDARLNWAKTGGLARVERLESIYRELSALKRKGGDTRAYLSLDWPEQIILTEILQSILGKRDA